MTNTEKITQILEKIFPGAELDLYETENKRVHGEIIWSGFDTIDDGGERVDLIYDALSDFVDIQGVYIASSAIEEELKIQEEKEYLTLPKYIQYNLYSVEQLREIINSSCEEINKRLKQPKKLLEFRQQNNLV